MLSKIIKPTVLASAIFTGLFGSVANAANHREAPLTALDHKADITDFFAFVSYDNPNKVTLILNVDPLLEPSNGPNYFPFDPEITYAIRVDNDHDAVEDVVFEFKFNTQTRLPKVFTSFVGAGNGVAAPANSPAPVVPGTPIVPPAITTLDGPGSQGLSLRQNFSVTVKRRAGNGFKTVLKTSSDSSDKPLIAVPSNVGPRTMPNYPALAAKGIYNLGQGIKVFAGTADDPFWIDLGAAFDSLNFRDAVAPGVLSAAQDAADSNIAADDVSGFNVNSIAIEVPKTLLTSDGKSHGAGEAAAVIGTWGTTSRPKVKEYAKPGQKARVSAEVVQIQRMGNPLFNELLIGTGFKDKFSMSQPRFDKQFANFALDPLLARVLNAVTGGALSIPKPPRLDLLPLVQYANPICPGCTTPKTIGPIADLLRLNTGLPPTPANKRSRLGALAGDLGGFPNGRRVSDDVFDISGRVVAGVLAGAPFSNANSPNSKIGDGVNANDVPYQETFPYVGWAQSGRDSRHIDPGEPGCTADSGPNCVF